MTPVVNMTEFVPWINVFFLWRTGFDLNIAGYILNMTGFVLNLIVFLLSMNGFQMALSFRESFGNQACMSYIKAMVFQVRNKMALSKNLYTLRILNRWS